MWKNVMDVLGEKDGIDSELLVFAMTLINKTLSNIPDQDTFYDVTDALEEQDIHAISQVCHCWSSVIFFVEPDQTSTMFQALDFLYINFELYFFIRFYCAIGSKFSVMPSLRYSYPGACGHIGLKSASFQV